MQYAIISFKSLGKTTFFEKKILKENNHTEAMSV